MKSLNETYSQLFAYVYGEKSIGEKEKWTNYAANIEFEGRVQKLPDVILEQLLKFLEADFTRVL